MLRDYFGVASLLIFVSGCASSTRSVSIPIWQKNVEKYVHEQGSGDPTLLRDVTLPDGRKGFAMLGNPVMEDSTDAFGLLLGHRALAGKPSFIYLVGLVNRGKIQDIRLATLTYETGKPRWALSPANPAALDAYRKYRDSLWRQRFPNRQEIPVESSNFPAPDDVIKLDVAADRLTAEHVASGATWTLGLGADARRS